MPVAQLPRGQLIPACSPWITRLLGRLKVGWALWPGRELLEWGRAIDNID